MRGHFAEDLTGRRFERLVVTGRAEDIVTRDGQKFAVWTCRCDCGEIVDVRGQSLRHGRTRSCGCLRRETSANTLAEARAARWERRRLMPKGVRAWE